MNFIWFDNNFIEFTNWKIMIIIIYIFDNQIFKFKFERIKINIKIEINQFKIIVRNNNDQKINK